MTPRARIVPKTILVVYGTKQDASPIMLHTPTGYPSTSPTLVVERPGCGKFDADLQTSSVIVPFFLQDSRDDYTCSSYLKLFSKSVVMTL